MVYEAYFKFQREKLKQEVKFERCFEVDLANEYMRLDSFFVYFLISIFFINAESGEVEIIVPTICGSNTMVNFIVYRHSQL